MAKVLLIEDDSLVSRMYQKVLRFEGLDVVSAENGRDGVEAAHTEHPDVILLDIMMPKMNGLEVLTNLKSDQATSKIPVVMLTNLSGTQDAENAMKKGAVDYLVKSQFKPREIAIKIKNMLAAPPQATVQEPTSPAAPQAANPPAVNMTNTQSAQAPDPAKQSS